MKSKTWIFTVELIRSIFIIGITISILAALLYFMGEKLLSNLLPNPYPYQYSPPYEYRSNVKYDPNNAISFANYLDVLANELDNKYERSK